MGKNRSGTLLKPLYSFAYLLISGSNQVDQILDSLRVNSRITVIILVNESALDIIYDTFTLKL